MFRSNISLARLHGWASNPGSIRPTWLRTESHAGARRRSCLAPTSQTSCTASWHWFPAPGSTVKGRPIPFDGPASGEEALIPVTKIQGPIFIDCGDDDAVWTSCQYSNRIEAELATGFTYLHPMLEFPDAGHGIGSIVPYLNYSEPLALQGRIPSSNQLARESAWPQLLTFLAGVARS